MFCSQCGAPNDDTSKFCIRCGARLIAVSLPRRRPPTERLRPAPMSSRISAGSKVTVGGALLVLLFFILPWVSCGGLASLSGLNLAGGVTIFFEEISLPWLWLVPLAAIGTLIVSFWGYRRGFVGRAVASIQLILGILAFLPLLPSWLVYEERPEGLPLQIGSGVWGTLLGCGAMIGGAIWDLGRGKPAEREMPSTDLPKAEEGGK